MKKGFLWNHGFVSLCDKLSSREAKKSKTVMAASSIQMQQMFGEKLRTEIIDFVAEVPDHLRCMLCKQPLHDPIQTIRGSVACKTCYFTSESKLCPIDHEMIDAKSEVFPDKFKANEIRKLERYCENKLYGCVWRGILADMEVHLQQCKHLPIQCIFCEKMISIVESKALDRHLQECDVVASHSNCIYSEYGCPFKVTVRSDYVKHLEDDVFLHCMMTYKRTKDCKQKVASMKENTSILREYTKTKLTEMERDRKTLSAKVHSLVKSIEGLEKLLNHLQSKVDKNSMEHQSVCNEDWKSGHTLLSSKIPELNEKISRADLSLALFENSTYDGTLLWKIDCYEDRCKKAVLGKINALHSAPCFTSKYGYKFCGRLYLNGDGMGRCTHLSMYLVIMKSPYDNLLQWPLTKRIKFRLLNQVNIGNDLIETFVPDALSSSYQKPVNSMNVATGCPMFACKEKLKMDGYLKDDCIFIELSVL